MVVTNNDGFIVEQSKVPVFKELTLKEREGKTGIQEIIM